MAFFFLDRQMCKVCAMLVSGIEPETSSLKLLQRSLAHQLSYPSGTLECCFHADIGPYYALSISKYVLWLQMYSD